MPVNEDGSGELRPFTAGEIAAMQIRTFGVRDGSHPSEVLRPNERSMVRKFLVAWPQRYRFAELVLGNEKIYNFFLDPPTNSLAETRLSRILPDLRYGRHPTFPQIMATDITSMRGAGSAGIDGDDGMPAYKDAEVEVQYQHHPFNIGSLNDPPAVSEMNRYLRLDASVRGETEQFGPLPGGALKATRAGGGGMSGLPIPYSFSVTQSIERLTVIWHKLPYLAVTDVGALCQRLNDGDAADVSSTPFRELRGYRGAVNSHGMVFESFGRTFAAGTLLLENTEIETKLSAFGESGLAGMRANVKFNFAHRINGWLDLFLFKRGDRPGTGYYRGSVDGAFYTPATFPDNNGLYITRDLNKLFNLNI